MKGLLFGGCSFTWGQGLYFYSDLPRQIYPLNEFSYRREELTDAHLRFKDTLRFPRLVANHFKTFEIVKGQNGGGEDETFDFFKTVFKHKVNERHDHYVSDNIEYEDIEYIIIQLSQIWRNRFYFTLNGKEDFAHISASNHHHSYNWENLLEWLTENNKTIEDITQTLFKEQYERFLREVKFYEEKGIKVRFLSWENEHYDILKDDSYLMERFIPLTYKDKTYDTIRKMLDDNQHLKIKGDVGFFGDNIPDDHHPSKECHEVIAENIIRRIESELK
jgi:hypothetical protein